MSICGGFPAPAEAGFFSGDGDEDFVRGSRFDSLPGPLTMVTLGEISATSSTRMFPPRMAFRL